MESKKQKAMTDSATASSHRKTSHLLLYRNTEVRTTRRTRTFVTSHYSSDTQKQSVGGARRSAKQYQNGAGVHTQKSPRMDSTLSDHEIQHTDSKKNIRDQRTGHARNPVNLSTYRYTHVTVASAFLTTHMRQQAKCASLTIMDEKVGKPKYDSVLTICAHKRRPQESIPLSRRSFGSSIR